MNMNKSNTKANMIKKLLIENKLHQNQYIIQNLLLQMIMKLKIGLKNLKIQMPLKVVLPEDLGF